MDVERKQSRRPKRLVRRKVLLSAGVGRSAETFRARTAFFGGDYRDWHVQCFIPEHTRRTLVNC